MASPPPDSASDLWSLRSIAAAYAQLGERLSSDLDGLAAFASVTDVAVKHVDGAESASITQVRRGAYTTLSPTSPVAAQADAFQYAARSGPCIDAAASGTVFRVDDLADDARWPEFARRAVSELGIHSVLSLRLVIDDGTATDGGRTSSGLNIYAAAPASFTPRSQLIATLLATHAAAAVSAVRARERVSNLSRALASNRQIGMAIGILMASHKLSSEQAFDLLRIASQASNRKLVDVAGDVTQTGSLDFDAAGSPLQRFGSGLPTS